MSKKIFVLLFSVLSLQMFYGCSSSNTADANPNAATKSWNEIDSEEIADSIVHNLLLSEWSTKFTKKRKPKIIVGSIENLTGETINTDLLSKNLERSLINSGEVTFISSKSKREMIRYNRRNRNNFEGDVEFEKYLTPLNSDFFMSGSINLSIDSISTPKLKEYQLILEIVKTKDLESVFITSQTLNK